MGFLSKVKKAGNSVKAAWHKVPAPARKVIGVGATVASIVVPGAGLVRAGGVAASAASKAVTLLRTSRTARIATGVGVAVTAAAVGGKAIQKGAKNLGDAAGGLLGGATKGLVGGLGLPLVIALVVLAYLFLSKKGAAA